MKKIEITSDVALFKWQSDVVSGILDNFKGYIHIVKAHRQCGKSRMLEMILLKVALEKKKSISICVSPTLQQADKIYKELIDAIKGTILLKSSNSVKMSLKLVNGSTIIFKSAEQDEAALQGFTVDGILCIDEAAFIPDNIFYAILPWVRVHKAPILITSTPRYKTGFFYKYYSLGLENGNKIISYDWSNYDTSALLTEEDKIELQKQLPKDIYISQVLGQFLDLNGSVFGNFSEIISDDFDADSNVVMGIDWGSGSGGDDTAIAIMNTKRQMVDLIHFNDKDETETIKAIVAQINKYKPIKIIVEKNSIGNIFYSLLKKEIEKQHINTKLYAFVTTNDSKEKLINKLQVDIQNKNIQLLNDAYLLTQLSVYEMKLSKSGKKTYNAMIGYKDDCIMATLLAIKALDTNNTEIRFI